MLRGIAAIVCYLIAVIAVAAACYTFLDAEGTNGELQKRLIAFAFVFGAMLLWIAGGAVTRRPMFTTGRVIVLLAIGFVGVVAARNLMMASGRSRPKRTLADIRTVATAIDAYAVDHAALPVAAKFDDLESQLAPTYLHQFPRTDGWGYPFRYESAGKHFAIGSAGKYGKWQHARLADYAPGTNKKPEDDIVFRDNEFVRYAP